MTVQSIEEALGGLKILSLYINLRDGGASIDVVHRRHEWVATYWGACVRVASGETAEEAIANVMQAVKACEKADTR